MTVFLVLRGDDEYGYQLFEACCISEEVAQKWIEEDSPHPSNYYIKQVEVLE